MSVTVQVSSRIWNWVDVSVRLNEKCRAIFELWRSGEKHPTFNQLESFS